MEWWSGHLVMETTASWDSAIPQPSPRLRWASQLWLRAHNDPVERTPACFIYTCVFFRKWTSCVESILKRWPVEPSFLWLWLKMAEFSPSDKVRRVSVFTSLQLILFNHKYLKVLSSQIWWFTDFYELTSMWSEYFQFWFNVLAFHFIYLFLLH